MYTAITEIYTLSLHDALPISETVGDTLVLRADGHAQETFVQLVTVGRIGIRAQQRVVTDVLDIRVRSEEHTSELQSHSDLVCRLLLEKKKIKKYYHINDNITT